MFRSAIPNGTAGENPRRAEIRAYGWDLETHQLRLTQFWANVNHPNDDNMQHNHAPNHLSGVYYVHVPEKSGDIRFLDDRRLLP